MGHRTGIYKIIPQKDGMKAVSGEEMIQKNYSDYLRDESNVLGGDPQKLFFPRSIENIVFIIDEARKNGKTVTVSGGRTGICAGAVPPVGGYLVSLEKMNRILDLELSFGEYQLKAESGIRLSELGARIKSKDFGLRNQVFQGFKKSKTSYFYPPDPTETTATLGGTIATNASGARTFFYGPTRDYVVGIEAVLPTGELLRIKRGDVWAKDGVFRVQNESEKPLIIHAPTYDLPKTKHSAGLYSYESMDLVDLFIGSEGILGIIVNATIRLVEEPEEIIGGVAFFQREDDAVDFVYNARNSPVKPLSLEYFDSGSLFLLDAVRKNQGSTSEIPEIEIFGGAVCFESVSVNGSNLKDEFLQWKRLIDKSHGDPSQAWGVLTRRDIMRLKSFRHAVPESINKIIAQNKLKDGRIHKVGTDMAVPDEYLRDMMHYYGTILSDENIDHVIFGHIGNNHLHVNMMPNTYDELLRAKKLYRLFADKAVSMGGSVSAEHGIGKLKKEYLRVQYSQCALDEMRAIKRTFDPLNMLNPGNVIY